MYVLLRRIMYPRSTQHKTVSIFQRISAKLAQNSTLLLSPEEQNQCAEAVETVILVTSTASHFKFRNVQREEFKSQNFQRYNMTYRYLLGIPSDKNISKMIVEENRHHDDIVMGTFEDTYRNLALKSILMLEWSKLFCSHAKFVIKTDDDVRFNLSKLHRYLSNLTAPSGSGYVLGTVANSVRKPLRDVRYKWYVSYKDYKENVFPTYAFGGAYLIAGENAVRKLYEATKHVKYLPMEDVYITGLCRIRAGIKLVEIRVVHLTRCVHDGFFCELSCTRKITVSTRCPFIHVLRDTGRLDAS